MINVLTQGHNAVTPVRLEPGPRGVGGWGGTPIFSYIRRLGAFFGVQNFEFQYFFLFFFWGGGGVQNSFFRGGGGVYEDFVYIFCGVITNWTIFSGYFNAF